MKVLKDDTINSNQEIARQIQTRFVYNILNGMQRGDLDLSIKYKALLNTTVEGSIISYRNKKDIISLVVIDLDAPSLLIYNAESSQDFIYNNKADEDTLELLTELPTSCKKIKFTGKNT